MIFAALNVYEVMSPPVMLYEAPKLVQEPKRAWLYHAMGAKMMRNGTMTASVFQMPRTEKNSRCLISSKKIGNANKHASTNCGLQPSVSAIEKEPATR